MPTGYTAKLSGGEQSFEDFVWTCARAFGALINMRDDALDAPLQLEEEAPPDSYASRSLVGDQAELERLRKLDRKECDREAAAEYATAIDEREKMREESEVKRKRYEAMIAKVEAWPPPTKEHEELKKFMLQQLGESIRFDCYVPELPKKIDGYTWVQEKLAAQVRHISYSAEQLGRDEAARRSRREWLEALRRSVPIPAVPPKAKKPLVQP